jgi:PIN domain nuclease of toxin-antitoxin system
VTEVWDASVLVDLVTEEPDADPLVSRIGAAVMNSVNWLEVVGWAASVRGVPVAAWAPSVREAGLQVLPFTAEHADVGDLVREAEREIRGGRSAKEWRGLSTADVALICFAHVEGLPVVTSDQVATATARRLGVSVTDGRRL